MWRRIYFHFLSSLSYIRANKLLTSFTAISYFIGILMPIFVVSIMAYDEKQAKASFMNHSEQIIKITGNQYIMEDLQQKENARIKLYDQINTIPAVQNVFHKTEAFGIIAYGTHMRHGQYMYVDEWFHSNFKQFVEEGRWFDPSRNDECIVGTELYNKLWRASGDQDQLFINNKQCSIIGKTSIFRNQVVMLHQADEDWRGFTTFYVKVDDSGSVEQVLSSLEHLDPAFDLERLHLVNKDYLAGQRTNNSLLLLITLSVFVYSIINISNVIKFMLDERRERYGIQIAMGSTKVNIIFEFFIELLLLTSVSLIAVLGILYFNVHLIAKYIITIRVDGLVIAATVLANVMICGMLSMLYLRKILSNNVVSLIRGDR